VTTDLRVGKAYEDGGVKLTIEIHLGQLPDPKGQELGRILRYWGSAAKQLDLSAPLEQTLRDSGYQPVGVLRIA
jgi:hypothetical protein